MNGYQIMHHYHVFGNELQLSLYTEIHLQVHGTVFSTTVVKISTEKNYVSENVFFHKMFSNLIRFLAILIQAFFNGENGLVELNTELD